MLKLVNSAMMPQTGSYNLVAISFEEFVERVRAEDVESFIGYPDNIALLKAWTGIEFPLSREKTTLQDGDRMIIMRLKYRVQNPADKGKFMPEENDFEFFLCDYNI